MIKQQKATFRFAHPMPPRWAVRFDVSHIPLAGQFVLVDLGGPLREVLFPAVYDDAGFTALVPAGHPATRLLPGAEVDLLGPAGRGFRLDNVQRLLLVADTEGFPLLQPLFNAAPSVALVVEGTTRAHLPNPAHIPAPIEVTLVTLDGSVGYLGPLEIQDAAPPGMERVAPYLFKLIAWADRACFACDSARYAALAALVQQARLQPPHDFAQALVQTAMPCGVGVCNVCRITTRHREKCVCTDGPVLDLLELAMD